MFVVDFCVSFFRGPPAGKSPWGADSLASGEFKPDKKIDRIESAEYLVSGFGIRQRLDLSGSPIFSDLRNSDPSAEVFDFED